MLALALGGRTIEELQGVMSAREFVSWREFWRAHPFDDDARFYRPAARLLHAQVGGDFVNHLRWMRRDVRPEPGTAPAGHWSEADLNTFKALGVKPPGA